MNVVTIGILCFLAGAWCGLLVAGLMQAARTRDELPGPPPGANPQPERREPPVS